MDMNLKTTSLDLMYTLPKLEKLETVIGANFLSQENKNHGEEMLIPDAEKMDIGIFGMWNYKLDNMDIMFGSRFDNREIKVAGDEHDYFSFSNSLLVLICSTFAFKFQISITSESTCSS